MEKLVPVAMNSQSQRNISSIVAVINFVVAFTMMLHALRHLASIWIWIRRRSRIEIKN